MLVHNRSERRRTILVAKADPFRLVTVATLTSDRVSTDVLRANGFMQRADQKFIVESQTTSLLPGNIHDPDAWRVFGGDFDAV